MSVPSTTTPKNHRSISVALNHPCMRFRISTRHAIQVIQEITSSPPKNPSKMQKLGGMCSLAAETKSYLHSRRRHQLSYSALPSPHTLILPLLPQLQRYTRTTWLYISKSPTVPRQLTLTTNQVRCCLRVWLCFLQKIKALFSILTTATSFNLIKALSTRRGTKEEEGKFVTARLLLK